MKYLEFTFRMPESGEPAGEILTALLGEIGFDSFMETADGLAAYIPADRFMEKELLELIGTFPVPGTEIAYSMQEMEDKNWNEEWERNYFRPIVIDDRCVIHSTFHTDVPEAPYDIIINPQMAFGTGHHETTSLIVGLLLDADLNNKSVLDMGCGTSILAILAGMRGASSILAVDIDSWCVENSKENIRLNNLTGIEVEQGDASSLSGRGPFDLVIANINRNILLNDMKQYVACMKPGSELYMSGFYTEDIPAIQQEAAKHGLTFQYHREKNNWAAVVFTL